MAVMEMDTGQWMHLKNAYETYSAYITPFIKCILDAYFSKHDENDKTIETREELDALIYLCSLSESYKKRNDSMNVHEIIEKGGEKQYWSSLSEEQYQEIVNLLEQLTEQREQYRLLHIRERANLQFVKRV